MQSSNVRSYHCCEPTKNLRKGPCGTKKAQSCNSMFYNYQTACKVTPTSKIAKIQSENCYLLPTVRPGHQQRYTQQEWNSLSLRQKFEGQEAMTQDDLTNMYITYLKHQTTQELTKLAGNWLRCVSNSHECATNRTDFNASCFPPPVCGDQGHKKAVVWEATVNNDCFEKVKRIITELKLRKPLLEEQLSLGTLRGPEEIAKRSELKSIDNVQILFTQYVRLNNYNLKRSLTYTPNSGHVKSTVHALDTGNTKHIEKPKLMVQTPLPFNLEEE